MKILRILVITACLNVPFAQAMDFEGAARFGTEMATDIAGCAVKSVIQTAGILAVIDGSLNVCIGKALILPIPAITKDQDLNTVLNVMIGVAEVSAGIAVLKYMFE